MKKVCFVVSNYDPYVGGTEILCKSVLEGISDKYNVSAITSPMSNREKSKYDYKIFDCHPTQFSLMKEHFQIFKYDLVIFFADLHTHYLNSYDFRSSSKNVCVLNLDERTYEMRNNFSTAVTNLKNFSNVFTFTKNGIANKFLEENNIKNTYIQNFSGDVLETIDIPSLRERLKLNNNKTILCNAAYEERKNQVKVIENISKSDFLSGLNWIFIGNESQNFYLEKCIDLSKKLNLKNTRFLKATRDTNKINQLYKISDCIFLGSVAEGMPLVLLEGMSANKPLVSTDVGGVKGVLQDEADIEILPINYNNSQLENSIKKQLNNKNCNNRQIWEKYFNKEIVIKKYKEEIEKLLC